MGIAGQQRPEPLTRGFGFSGRNEEEPMSIKMKQLPLWVAALAIPGTALANADVAKLIKDPKNWPMQAGNFENQRYSNLNQINKKNVKDLKVAWTFSTGVLRGHEGGPLVIGDTLFVHSPFPNKVFAIDLETQKVGVFGRLVKLDAPLRPGDRVEIYRPITCDPQTVPRRDGSD